MKNMNFFLGSILIMTISTIASEVDVNGYIKTGYQNQKTNSDDLNDFAIGGKVNIELKSDFGLSGGISIYGVNALYDKNNIGVPFYSTKNDSYTILGEAYIKTKISKTKFILGRQGIDSPYINMDDIGMIPNLFEGISMVSKDIKDTKITVAHFYKWSGVDSDTPEQFTRMNNKNGVQVFGAIYKGFKNSKLKAWFYNMEDFATFNYFELNYDLKINNIDIALAGQYSNQDYDNGDNSDIYGLAVEATYENLGLNISYNNVDGVGANNSFGGGPFFTNSEHMTLPDAMDNGKALMIGASLDLSKFGLDNFTFGSNYLTLTRENLNDITELDLVLGYDYDNLSLEIIYSDMQDKSDDNNNFKNLRVFINYNF